MAEHISEKERERGLGGWKKPPSLARNINECNSVRERMFHFRRERERERTKKKTQQRRTEEEKTLHISTTSTAMFVNVKETKKLQRTTCWRQM